jgi:hypothetical protein
MGEPQGPRRPRKLALSPGPLRIVPARRPEPMSKAWAPGMGQSHCHRHDRLHDSAPSPPARVVTVTAHCPGAKGDGKVLEARGAVQRVLGGAQSLARDIEPPGPRQHPPPATTSAVDGFYTCCGCTLRDDDDDFEAYSTAAIIDHRREHQTADTTFPLMPATICRLTPLRTMRGSRQRARIADHDRRSRRWPTC